MSTRFPIRVQQMRSKGQQPRFYVYVPLALAAALGIEAGEEVHWELLGLFHIHYIKGETMMFDPLYMMMILPGVALALLATFVTKTTFAKYSRVAASSGLSGVRGGSAVVGFPRPAQTCLSK